MMIEILKAIYNISLLLKEKTKRLKKENKA
jgi:hypothetical protein